MAASTIADQATINMFDDATRAALGAVQARVQASVDFWASIGDAVEAVPVVERRPEPAKDPWNFGKDGPIPALDMQGAYADIETAYFDVADNHALGDHVWITELGTKSRPAPLKLDATKEEKAAHAHALYVAAVADMTACGDIDENGDAVPGTGEHGVHRVTFNQFFKKEARPTVAEAEELMEALEIAAAKRAVLTWRVTHA